MGPSVRASLQEHRRRPPERGRLHHRARLHRADLLAAVPQVPRRPGAGQGRRGRARRARSTAYILDKPYRWESWAAPKGKDGKLDHNKALTGDDLRDFVNRKLFPYLHGFKQKASGPEHHRVQDRRDLRRDQEQDPERLQPARDHRPHRRAALPLADREARALAPLRSQDQEHGQRRAQRRRVLHAAPAHPRHRPGRRSRRSASASTTAPSARRASCARRSTTSSAKPGLHHRQDLETLQDAHLLRQGEEVARLRHRDHEHDPARHRGAEHHPHQHAHREPRRHSGEGPLRRRAGQSALRRQGAQGGPAELPDPHRRDGVPVPPALHQDAQGRRARRRGHQEHVPLATPTTPR